MKILTVVLLMCTIIYASCSKNTKNEVKEPLSQNQTPEAFENKSEISSFSTKRYDSDLIQKLYQEAMDKNKELKSLNEEISEIGYIKNDSLVAYQKYIQQNAIYYRLVGEYINGINDSTLKNEAKEIFAKLENECSNKISRHKLTVENIDTRTQILNDQLILMKLFVTAPMMRNYQINELPDIKSINYISLKYDSLINDTKPYMKIK